MSYQLGGEFTFKKLTSEDKVATLNTGHMITGIRAFARNEKTGKYREVLGCSQEQEWVDGTNEGAWFHHTHETKEEASTLAWRAYRWMNKLKK